MSKHDEGYIPSDARQNSPLGWLNQDRPPSTGITIDNNTRNSEYAVQQTMVDYINPVTVVTFPRKAIVVWVEEYVSLADSSYTGLIDIGRTVGLNPHGVRIKAYDDFIDGGSFPMPNLSGIANQNLTVRDAILYNMCQSYYGQDTVGSPAIEVPSPGDIVWIDFADRENLRGGIYKGIAEKVSIIPSSYAASALDSMQDAIGIPLMEMDVGAGVGGGTEANIDDLCDGPVSTRGSEFGGGSIETVIVDGAPIAKDVAGYWITMRDAAADATPSVTLRIDSGFRANEDLEVDTNCPLDGEPDTPFEGQQTLYNNYRARVKWAEDTAASPSEEDIAAAMGGANPHQQYNRAAVPGTSQHQNGIAFDINIGYGDQKDWKIPHPEAMTLTYKWLLLNAHKYGFVRTVLDERWHWEYTGGGAQFQQDKNKLLTRSHATWDSFFEEGSDGAEMLEESREGSITSAEEEWEESTAIPPPPPYQGPYQ